MLKILMVGATGKYASFVLPELKKRGTYVRALVRDESGAEAAILVSETHRLTY